MSRPIAKNSNEVSVFCFLLMGVFSSGVICVAMLGGSATSYGGIDARTGEMHVVPYPKAESAATTDFLTEMMYRYPKAKLTICWENATWHRGEEICRFLNQVNAGLPPEAWPLTLRNFAPHDPEQNPVEEVWRQGKNDLRQQRLEASQFSAVIAAFEARLERQVFDFPKLRMYEAS